MFTSSILLVVTLSALPLAAETSTPPSVGAPRSGDGDLEAADDPDPLLDASIVGAASGASTCLFAAPAVVLMTGGLGAGLSNVDPGPAYAIGICCGLFIAVLPPLVGALGAALASFARDDALTPLALSALAAGAVGAILALMGLGVVVMAAALTFLVIGSTGLGIATTFLVPTFMMLLTGPAVGLAAGGGWYAGKLLAGDADPEAGYDEPRRKKKPRRRRPEFSQAVQPMRF